MSQSDTGGAQAPLRGDTQETAKHFRFSESFLEKDRIGAQRIPFIKLGRKVMYDFASVEAALAAYQVGGPSPAGRRARR